MDLIKIKPQDILNASQLSEIRKKHDYRNVFALMFDWGLIASGFYIFYYFQA